LNQKLSTAKCEGKLETSIDSIENVKDMEIFRIIVSHWTRIIFA
jgi:hypothetical protein